jgi:hypothetical protein
MNNSGAIRAAGKIGVDASPNDRGSIKSEINLTIFLL